MRAIVFESYGAPDELHVVDDRPEPDPGPGQVRVRVEAAGVNVWDGKVRSGAMSAFVRTTFPAVPGLEAAGVVDRVGPGVTGVSVGDRVTGWTRHGHAELAVLHGWASVPPSLEPAQAAAIPVVAEAATRVLALLDPRPGSTLLVHGASGGVGGLAAQLARAAGVTVIGTASAAQHDRLRGWGITPTTYGDGLVERVRALAPQGVDAVLDAAGRGVLPESIELRGSTDRVVTIADPSAMALGVTFSQGAEFNPAALAEVVERVTSGDLEVPLAATFPMEAAAEAQALVDGGHPGGKVVLVL
ncbi:NADP-dependent oxidoreductase [Xylanimonas sp. McL0601]|uniref:NADP-dependent oxidoreductase n=1 Tax=Xylanimonas sp. McL0601 TaxID=3414739 RepID=UPI003CF3B2A2